MTTPRRRMRRILRRRPRSAVLRANVRWRVPIRARSSPARCRSCSIPASRDRWSVTSSSPSPGPYNLHLEPGEVTPKELISDIAQGFYVTDLIGSGVNGVTGDYSRGASGFWIENGNITYPVSEVTIAGHLLEMFKSLAPANDLEFRYGVNAPTVRIEGLTLGGR